MALRYGASALGLVSEMPSGPGVISEDQIAEITNRIPPGVATFLLTSKQDVESIIKQQYRCRVNTLQLVDRLEHGSLEELREALPGISIVQVIHVTGQEAIEEAEAVCEHVDALLLDSGNPNLKVKKLGGTGRTHNWQISKMIRERLDVPIYLAGGLKPENVCNAINEVSPFGIDICSGVRTNGSLDTTKLKKFFSEVEKTSLQTIAN